MRNRFGRDGQSAKLATRVVIADGNELTRQGLRSMIASEGWIEVVGLAASGREVVAHCENLHPDLLLIDLRLPDLDGLIAIRRIKAIDPRIVVIVVTAYENAQFLVGAMHAGASAYLLKDCSRGELIDAMCSVLRHEPLLSPKMYPQLFDYIADGGPEQDRFTTHLTARENDVLNLLAEGKSNREIAQQMVITEGTVKSHIGHIFEKLEVTNRTQAVVQAISWGLVMPAAV